MAKESLERIICDLPPLDFVVYTAKEGHVNDVGVICYGNREFAVGELHYCDTKKYLECRKIYKRLDSMYLHGRGNPTDSDE